MISILAQTTPLEYTIAGAIVLCGISIATMLTRSAIRREDRKTAAYEKDLEIRRASDLAESKERQEEMKGFHSTIETLTRDNHKAALNQMRERTQLDSKNLETLRVIADSTSMSSQSIAGIQELLKELKQSTDATLKLMEKFKCNGGDDA